MKKLTLALCVLIGSNAYANEAAQTSAAAMQGNLEAGKTKAAVCGACHGMDGNSTAPAAGAPDTAVFPKIAGQHASYLYKQLVSFKDGKKRQNLIMNGQAAALSEQDMLDLAAYFSSQAQQQGAAAEDLVKAGEALYRGGNKDKKLPACMSCHGPSGMGIPAANYPRVGGQHSAYVLTQLNRFKAGNHADDAQGKMMQDIATRLSESEAQAVASYINGLHE